MGRSIKKGPFIDGHLLEKIQKAKDAKSKTPIKTWSRRSMITPDVVGRTFSVHNGKVFNPVFVTENLVGHRLGELSLTPTFNNNGAQVENLRVLSAVAGTAATLKRMTPKARGSSGPILKRHCHVKIVVSDE